MFLEKYINFSWYYLTCKSRGHVFHRSLTEHEIMWNILSEKLENANSATATIPKDTNTSSQNDVSGEKDQNWHICQQGYNLY